MPTMSPVTTGPRVCAAVGPHEGEVVLVSGGGRDEEPLAALVDKALETPGGVDAGGHQVARVL